MNVWETRAGFEFLERLIYQLEEMNKTLLKEIKTEPTKVFVLNNMEQKEGLLIQWNNDGSALVQIENHFAVYNPSSITLIDE